jgi:hypothetical protein
LSPPLLTVLTDPVPFGIYFPIETTKRLLRKIKRKLKPLPHYMVSSYRGHPAVTRSLVEGLAKIHASANYNPNSLIEIGETVVVLSGISALKQAIRLKRKGHIKHLLAGPNMMELPSDYNGLAASPEVDFYIINCEWTKKLYEDDCPALVGRCVIWPAGVDTEYWKPDPSQTRDTILIYEKQRKGPVGPIEPYKKWMEEQGYKVQVIKCGEYFLDEFLHTLQHTQLMLGFVIDESQGIAWAEAWSADVPTLIWRNIHNSYRGRNFESSTAPYLTKDTGLFFDDFENFKFVFTQWESMKNSFHPRQWVLENMSDEVSASLLCQLANVRLSIS